jgi:uncharacterized protein YwgA
MTYDNSRLRRLALISLVLQSAGPILGRTKLQKILYLANSVGWKALDFKYHNYGPYSESLASELDNMRNYGWIEEHEISTSQERVLYEYHFSSRYRQTALSLQGKIEDTVPNGKQLISRTKGLVKQLNEFSSDELQIMSTLVFLRAQDPSMSEEQVVDMARKLKPQFAKEDISKGKRIFNIMRNFWPSQSVSRVVTTKPC